MLVAVIIASFFLLVYVLWGFFLMVMALKHARDAGRLSVWGNRLGKPILYIGYVLDFIVNMTVMTVIMFEWPHEWLVTARVKRHLYADTRRGKIARWLDSQLLDPIDPGHSH